MKTRVVVTGACGFVGSHLVRMLSEREFEVVSIDTRKNTKQPPGVKHYSFDLNTVSNRDLSQIVENSVIVHLAAISKSVDCEQESHQAIDVNLKLTKKIIEIANSSNSQLIFASSEWVYPETLDKTEVSEEADLHLSPGANFYSMTKIVGEWMVEKYSSDFRILRFGIIYGERKTPESAVESIVHSAFISNVIKLGNSQTARRFIYIEDICSGIIRCIENYQKSPRAIFNLTGERLVSLEEIVELCGKSLQKKLEVKLGDSSASIRNPSSNLFNSVFSWQPKISIEAGIEKLVNWEIKKREIEC